MASSVDFFYAIPVWRFALLFLALVLAANEFETGKLFGSQRSKAACSRYWDYCLHSP
jgi:hypothetical protein